MNEEDSFDYNELCDGGLIYGGNCPKKTACTRWMGNVDTSLIYPYVISVVSVWPVCPYYTDKTDEKNYPRKNNLGR